MKKIKVSKTEYDVFDSLQVAIDDGILFGLDKLPLSSEAIDLLKQGKVLKADNCEYVQIIYLAEETGGKEQ